LDGKTILHGTLGHSRKPHSFAICLQGGGALGAFSLGAVEETLGNPYFENAELLRVAGTSIGAFITHSLAEGWWHGLKSGESPRQHAVARAKAGWKNLIDFQNDHPALWFLPYYVSSNPIHAAVSEMMRTWGRAVNEMMATTAHLLEIRPESPLLEYYRKFPNQADERHKSSKGNPVFEVNGSIYDGRSMWSAEPRDEHVFQLNDLSPRERHVAVALSGCLDSSQPVSFRNKLFHDGAFASPIPRPLETARFCFENEATMVIVRTRPTGASWPEQHQRGSEDGMRFHFNRKMDLAIDQIREEFPQLPVLVVEPKYAERTLDHSSIRSSALGPELSFDPKNCERRIEHGKACAEMAINTAIEAAESVPYRSKITASQRGWTPARTVEYAAA
jgi:predicted acylesterase/phospholipase RssA